MKLRTLVSACVLLAAAALCAVLPAAEPAAPAAAPAAPAAPAAWNPKFFAFCIDSADAKKRTFPQQVEMVRELGFDGVGYEIWTGEAMAANLKLLDEARLQPFIFWIRVNVNPAAKTAYDARIKAVLPQLKGRPTILCVLLHGLKPGDRAGMDHGAKVLRDLGDLAAAHDLRVSIYHHMGDWTQNLPFALEVVKKADHPRVGVNFNLCHWLMAEGDKDYRPLIRENVQRIFVVSINGAKLGSRTWTNGLIQPLDQGDFDNAALLRCLKEAGYRGDVGLMAYGVPGDTGEHLARSMKAWKTIREKL